MDAMKRVRIQRLVTSLEKMEELADEMVRLYDEHPELNDEVNIGDLIPASLDEWQCQIMGKIDEIKKLLSQEAVGC